MSQRYQHPFTPIDSTAPSFQAAVDGATAQTFALQSTGEREWFHGPGARSIRFADTGTEDYYMVFGTSDITVGSTNGTLILGGTVEIFTPVKPSHTHIAMIGSSTDTTVNVTLGYGS